jgi:3-oxoacyl-[acyl-carrier-protein] synthase-3
MAIPLFHQSLPYRCLIQGVGGYLPETHLTNDEISDKFNLDTSDQWIRERTGILQRHVAEQDESTSSLAILAAKSALQNAQLDADAIDLIIVATSTPERMFPSTATIVQNGIHAKNAVSFDMNAACSGFLFALAMGQSYLMQSGKNHALIIGSETMTRLLNWQDRGTCILFGDGAGAVVLSRTPSDRGILGHCLFSDGKDGKALRDLHVTKASAQHPMGVIEMNGQSVFREAVAQLTASTKALLKQENVPLEAIDWIIPHQANKRILDHMQKDLGVPAEKMLYTGDFHANTSAASIPLTWWKARQDGTILPGQLLLLQAFGAGFTWGACLVRS